MRFMADRFYQIIAQYLRQLVQLSSFARLPMGAWLCPDDPVTTYFPPTYSMTRKRLFVKDFTTFMHVLCSFLYSNEAEASCLN
jgi:hypothetical protein